MIAALSTEHFHLSSMDGRTKWAIEVNFDSNQNALEGVQLIIENTLSASITIKLNWKAWRDRSLLETLWAWNWSFLLDLRVFFCFFFNNRFQAEKCIYIHVSCQQILIASVYADVSRAIELIFVLVVKPKRENRFIVAFPASFPLLRNRDASHVSMLTWAVNLQ